MASLKAKSTISNLLQKGFIFHDSHHHYYEFWHEGEMICKTYLSHSGGDIDDYLIASMRKQCLMEKQFFIEFAKCTKSKQDYIESLIVKGIIPPRPDAKENES